MIERFRRHWPLVITLAALAAILLLFLLRSLGNNGGHLIYALDDPYIHMAMAKNLALHGVWGATRYAFSSTSSSPLWTALLALSYLIFGVNELAPFVLSLASCVVCVCVLYALLRKYGLAGAPLFVVLNAIVYTTPLPSLVFTGLEHILHTTLSLLLVERGADALCASHWSARRFAQVAGLAFLLTLTRYEGLFLVGVLCAFLALRRRWGAAVVTAGAGLAPIVGLGLLSMAHGGYFLPNSVLLKGNVPSVSLWDALAAYTGAWYQQMLQAPHVLTLVLVALALFVREARARSLWEKPTLMLALFVLAALAHMQLARTGWFFRYEAYLMSLGLFAVAVAARECMLSAGRPAMDRERLPAYLGAALLILILAWPVLGRALGALRITPRATTNIYEQQYQMGRFVREFYEGQSIALNDIGAVNYLADVRCLDIVGLASTEVARARLEGHYDAATIGTLAERQGVRIAIVYDHLLTKRIGGVPQGWVRVGQWRIRKNVVCEDDTVSFYAVAPAEREALVRHLKAFSARLPREVVQSGAYTQP